MVDLLNPSAETVASWRRSLGKLLVEKSLEFRTVTLTSGKASDYYVDCKRTSLHPRGLWLCTALLLHQLRQGAWPDAVGGPTLGADPLVSALAMASADAEKPLPAFIIRKEPKKHGTQAWIEGMENVPKSGRVALIEDVVTTAGSSIASIEKMQNAGLRVERVLCLLDRQEGGREALQKQGFQLEALFTGDELKALRGKAA